jgi:hypothetical protein
MVLYSAKVKITREKVFFSVWLSENTYASGSAAQDPAGTVSDYRDKDKRRHRKDEKLVGS